MNTSQFTTQEKFLMIRSINFRLTENYDVILKLLENKRNFNTTVKPLHSVLDKLCQQSEKLTKRESMALAGCITDHGFKHQLSKVDLLLIQECRKKIKIK